MRNKSTISTLLPFQGVNGFTNDNPTQGAASLALGFALHWAFSPPRVSLAQVFCASLGFQPALVKLGLTSKKGRAPSLPRVTIDV